MDLPKLSIIIVSWNVREILKQNLARLSTLQSDDFLFEIFVIDNGSKDGSAKMVREEFPSVHLIQNDYNAGFGKACNQGLRMARGEVLLLLNPDMLVGEGALQKTYEKLKQNESIGVLGVKLIHENGELIRSVRRDPTVLSQMAIFLKLPHLLPHINDHYLAQDFDLSVSREVEQVRGSYFAFRRDVLERVGFLDERFFIWFEEVDYCKRVREKGLRVFYFAEVSCTDLIGRSFIQVPTWKKQLWFFKSALSYFLKWEI